jgi:hypothetical protein
MTRITPQFPRDGKQNLLPSPLAAELVERRRVGLDVLRVVARGLFEVLRE